VSDLIVNFYIQKLKLQNDTLLFQLYFYKTYLLENFLRRYKDIYSAADSSTVYDYPTIVGTSHYLHFYNQKLLHITNKLKLQTKKTTRVLKRYFVKKRRQKFKAREIIFKQHYHKDLLKKK
jgi:hypothetical protein